MAAPKGNTNAEKWTEEEAIAFMDEAVELSRQERFDFIGEVAKEMESYRDVFDYLLKKFPSLKTHKKIISQNCEANCFSNAKKGDIVASVAIMNLKSNHQWTDRIDGTSGGVSLFEALTDVTYESDNTDSTE